MSNDDTGLNSSVADAAAGVPETQQTEATPDQNNGLNPAWNDLIEKLPTQFVPQITPVLQQWDKGVQERFQKVQSTYAPYKPFVEGGVTPEQIDAAMRLMQAVEADPRSFYEKMGQYYATEWGLDQGQGSDDADEYSLDDLDDEDQGPVDLENNPYIQQIKQQQDLLVQFTAAQYEQQQQAAMAQAQAQADEEIKTEVETIQAKYGELDKEKAEIIFGMAMQSDGKMTLVQAADKFFAIAGGNAPRQQTVIMSPGGGVPANNVNPAELNGQDRRKLVESILAQAAQANKQ